MLVELQLTDKSFAFIQITNIEHVTCSSKTTLKTEDYGEFANVSNLNDPDATYTITMISGKTYTLTFASWQLLREMGVGVQKWDPDYWKWSRDGNDRIKFNLGKKS